MSGQHSRRKGQAGERELAAVLTGEGFEARRGQQRIAIVAHRRNHHPWVVVLLLEDLLAIVRASDFVTNGGLSG